MKCIVDFVLAIVFVLFKYVYVYNWHVDDSVNNYHND
jgi:hypothetical protein